MIHLTLDRVMSSCHAASLSWSFREDTYLFLNMHIHLTCYSFTALFLSFRRDSFLFSQSLPSRESGYVLSRVGADMALLQARRSQASPLIFLMLFFSLELRSFSI